jgi:hypothetical protein
MRSECRSLSAYRTIVNQWLKLFFLCHCDHLLRPCRDEGLDIRIEEFPPAESS